MPYCSLEEAWGDNLTSDYFQKVNKELTPASSSIHSRIPPQLSQDGLSTSQNQPSPNENIPSYSGALTSGQSGLGVPSVSSAQSMKSNIVPYKVNFPDRAKRNTIHPINENEINDDDLDIDVLEDNDHDMRHIDIQRRVKPEYEPDYMDSQDYFLYKKYLNLAEKYKAKLRKKFKNFIDEDTENKNILESFSNFSSTPTNESYSFKDIFIIIIVGIFIIFALDIFVKMGSRLQK